MGKENSRQAPSGKSLPDKSEGLGLFLRAQHVKQPHFG